MSSKQNWTDENNGTENKSAYSQKSDIFSLDSSKDVSKDNLNEKKDSLTGYNKTYSSSLNSKTLNSLLNKDDFNSTTENTLNSYRTKSYTSSLGQSSLGRTSLDQVSLQQQKEDEMQKEKEMQEEKEKNEKRKKLLLIICGIILEVVVKKHRQLFELMLIRTKRNDK
ncbi:MAG: hypothetical protein E7062_10875 [Spirochaetaceae bacterium]|nr:hypothetical protein [Spirochaetaceae bacterium]